MALRRVPAVFMRGGTSKALVFHERDLPADPDERTRLFLGAIGSPDPYGRQLDGMGGGVSSLSKICIVAPPSRADADVDYTFVQMAPKDAVADYGGNCGNMSSAIGPFAVEEGLVPCPADGEAVVRIHNTNTAKIIVARFAVAQGAPAPDGAFALDGVAGTAAPIRLEFLAPGGARTGKLLPTGRPLDLLDVPGLGPVEASCVDAGNPVVFVAAPSVGKTGTELPDALEADPAFLDVMERIRLAGSVAMGIAPDPKAAARIASVPKVAMLSAPAAALTVAGETMGADAMDIAVRMISVGAPHRAVPITGSIALAVAARLPGTIAERLRAAGEGAIRIGHPSGTITVDASVAPDADGVWQAAHGTVYRTARRLFEGAVVYRA